MKISAVMIGVQDLERSKTFYGEGLGCTIAQDYPQIRLVRPGRGIVLARAVPVGRSGPGRRRLARGIRVPRRVVPLHRRVAG